MIDESTLEVSVDKNRSINGLFEGLDKQGIQVLSMRNKANRLEELFFDLVEKKLVSSESEANDE